MSSPKDYATVVGEYASFACRFNGSADANRPISPLRSYWVIDTGNEPTLITTNSTNYRITAYQTCSNVEKSCCQFISKLMMYNVTLMSNVTVKCYESFQQQQQSNTLTVNDANGMNYSTGGATLSKHTCVCLCVCVCVCVFMCVYNILCVCAGVYVCTCVLKNVSCDTKVCIN